MTTPSKSPAENTEMSFREEFALPNSPPLKEGPGPVPVDLELIKKYYEGLGEDGEPNENGLSNIDEWRRVHELMNYAEWHDAGQAVILEQYNAWEKLQKSLGLSTD